MTATPTRPAAPTIDVDAPGLSISTVSVTVSIYGRLRLDEARADLAAATDALAGWYARQTAPGHSYVSDGHETIRLIDTVVRELDRVRAALVGEIRAAEDERAARVDRMIAESQARRASSLSGQGATAPDGGAA
jgi:hypothetical protein